MGDGEALSPAELSEGHALVYKICTESSQPKDAENQCYTLYLDYCRGIAGQFGEGKARRVATQALKGIFKYLDQHFTGTKDRPGMVRTKQPTSKLCAGQDLKTSAAAIADDARWIPDYQAAPASDAAPVAPAGLYRAASAPKPLERATSMNTLNNIGDLKGWVAVQATKWVSGVAITPAEMSEGHALVYKICTESSQPKDAENQCYTLYLDYCRGICGEFGEGKERRTAFQALKAIFKYLDQHFTGSKDRPGMVRSKQPTSKLCAGQNLSSSAREIAADANWIPDYQAAPAAAAPVQPAAQLPLSVVSRHSDFLNQPLYGDANNSVNRCTIYGDFAQLLDKFGVAGLSIGTLHNGVVGSTCSGLAQREDPYNACTSARSLPMQADTWVQVASLSKTVATAFAMEYLGERGINFDTNVNQLLAKIGSNYRLQPADRAPASWANEVQLRHLVNHTGLGMHYVYGFPPDRMRGMPPMQDLMEGKHNYESIFVSKKPNTKFAYSGGLRDAAAH